MERAERTAGSRLGDLGSAGATPDAFRFGVETRIQVQAMRASLGLAFPVLVYMLVHKFGVMSGLDVHLSQHLCIAALVVVVTCQCPALLETHKSWWQDEGSGAVAYRPAVDNVWALEVPLEAATNQAELHDYQVRSVYPRWGR
jgi:hypothetical protein